jgi:hypothetical protein
MTANNTEYNGWTNYETWVVALWMNNSESNGYRSVLIADTKDLAKSKQISWLADALQVWVDEDKPLVNSSLYLDLINASLSKVNWREIATNFLAE